MQYFFIYQLLLCVSCLLYIYKTIVFFCVNIIDNYHCIFYFIQRTLLITTKENFDVIKYFIRNLYINHKIRQLVYKNAIYALQFFSRENTLKFLINKISNFL